jgi:hypothetical protein
MDGREIGRAMQGLHDAASARARIHAVVGYFGFAVFVAIIGTFVYWCFNPDFIRILPRDAQPAVAGETAEQAKSRWWAEIRTENDRRAMTVIYSFSGGPLNNTTNTFYTGEIIMRDAVEKLPTEIVMKGGAYYFVMCRNYKRMTHEEATDDDVLGAAMTERRAIYAWREATPLRPHGSLPGAKPIGDGPPKTGAMPIPAWNSWGPGDPGSRGWLYPASWTREQCEAHWKANH